MSDAANGSTAMNAERLFGYLREASFLRMLWAVGAAAVRGGGVFIFAVLVAIVLDASFGLGSRWLLSLDLALLGLLCAGLLQLAAIAWRRRFHARRVAVDLEQALGLDGSELIAAVDLAGGSSPAASESLRAYAVRRGDELAATLPAGAAVDRDAMVRAARLLGVAVAVLVVAYFAFPRVFHAVVPRLAQPYADHPPFTLLEFGVRTEPEAVIQGHGAAIRVAIDGPTLPEQASLVWVESGGQLQRTPLLRSASPGAKGEEEPRHFVLRLDRVEADRVFYIDTSEGRSRQYTLDVVPVPLFEQVRVRYDYPAYTGWDPVREPLRLGAGIRALRGTQVTLEVTSNVALEGGTLTLTPEEGLDAPPDKRRLITSAAAEKAGVFVFGINHNGTIEAVLRSGGLTTPEPLRLAVTAVPDEKPRVSFAEPSPTVIAPEGWRVDVRVEASDDIGLGRLELQRSVNGFAPAALQLPAAGDDGRRREAAYRFDLAALGARAGDVITYFATAYDNMPAPQLTQTDVYVIQVVSQSEYDEFARTQYRIDDLNTEWEEYQRRLDDLKARREHALNELAELREQLAGGAAPTPEQQARMEGLEAELDEYRQEALGLAEDMRDRAEQNGLYDFEQAYKDQLARTEQELQMQASEADATRRALREMRQSPSSERARKLAQQAQRFRERDQPFDEQMTREREQLTGELEKVQLADEMAGAAERIGQVIKQQRDLAERMQQFKQDEALEPADQRLANKLAEEQSNLREELADAKKQLEDTAARATEQLPKMSGTAAQLCERIGALGVEADQRSAADNAYSGQGSGAARDAMAAAEKLESLLSDCNSMGDPSGELDGCLGLPRESWKNAMNQLAQGRGVPGMGSKPGASGSGFSGSAARMAVVGPSPSGGDGEGPSRAGRVPKPSNDRGGATADEDDLDVAERIDAEATEGRSTGVTALTGVPTQYREAAEAYFRRLVEDERYDRVGPAPLPGPPGDQP